MHYEVKRIAPCLVEVDGVPVPYEGKLHFMKHVAAMRLERGLDLSPGWDQRLMAEAHARGEGWVAKRGGGGKAFVVGVYSVAGFVARYLRWRNNGGGLCGREVAQQRVQTCRACPANVDSQSCAPCKAAVKMLLDIPEVIPGARFCGVCGCACGLKAWATGDLLDDRLEYPENCWIHSARAGR